MGTGSKAGVIAGFHSETVSVDGVRLHCRIGGDSDGQPVEVETLADGGHFLPKEQPGAVIRQVLAMASKFRNQHPAL